jgi:hypothetical protein
MSERFGALEIEDEQTELLRDIDATPESASSTWHRYERREHFPTSDVAVRARDRAIATDSGMVESWLVAMKVVATGLLWTTVLLAGCLFLTWLAYLAH